MGKTCAHVRPWWGPPPCSLSAALAAPAVAAGPAPARHEHTREAVEAAVAAGVPGATATVRDTHGSWSAAAGVGDTRTGKPRSAADRYRVASITKTFVATVLLQLEAEGRLSLDDSVERWLPGVVRGHGHDGRGITLRQLLNHTSGVHDYLADPDFRRAYFTPGGLPSGTATTPSPPRSWWTSRCGTSRTSRRAPPGGTPTPTTSWPAW